MGAATEPPEEALDVLWTIVTAIFILSMQAGFLMLEAGSIRKANEHHIILKNIMDTAAGGLVYALLGYPLSFAPGNGFIGDTWVTFNFSTYEFARFFQQWAFAAVATTIVSGAVSERCSIKTYLAYSVVVTGFVYPVVAYWAWNDNGWLKRLDPPYIDQAGSGVVHVVGGATGFIGTYFLGVREKRFKRIQVTKTDRSGRERLVDKWVVDNQYPGQSLTMVTLGTFILWIGWYGFNCGSNMKATSGGIEQSAAIAVATTLSPCASGVSTFIMSSLHGGTIDATRVLNGVLAGLVAITAPCAVVSPLKAAIIGFIAGIVFYGCSCLLLYCTIDDPVDATSVHFAGGMWGVLAAGLFTDDHGVFINGEFRQLGSQVIGAVAILAWTGAWALLVFGSLWWLSRRYPRVSELFRRDFINELGLLSERQEFQKQFEDMLKSNVQYVQNGGTLMNTYLSSLAGQVHYAEYIQQADPARDGKDVTALRHRIRKIGGAQTLGRGNDGRTLQRAASEISLKRPLQLRLDVPSKDGTSPDATIAKAPLTGASLADHLELVSRPVVDGPQQSPLSKAASSRGLLPSPLSKAASTRGLLHKPASTRYLLNTVADGTAHAAEAAAPPASARRDVPGARPDDTESTSTDATGIVESEAKSSDDKDTRVFTVKGCVPGELKVQVASDLHMEMWNASKYWPRDYIMQNVIIPSAPILALLGDVGLPGTEQGLRDYQEFLLYQADRFELVLLLAGNHEYYSTHGAMDENPLTVGAIKKRIYEVCAMRNNIVFLDAKAVEINGVRVVGATLWTAVSPFAASTVESGLNDYQLAFVDSEKGPRRLTVNDTVKWHEEELKFIQEQAQLAKRLKQNVLVLTHHSPTFRETSAPQHTESPIASAFSTSLDYLFDYGGNSFTSAIHTWCFGHTHWIVDQYIGGVHLRSNQYGYVGSAEEDYLKYDADAVVTIP